MRRSLLAPTLAGIVASLGTLDAFAVPPETRIASSFEEGNPFDANVTVGFRSEWKKAKIRREFQEAGFSDGGTRIVNDLMLEQSRKILDLKAAIGLAPGVEVHLGLPLVLSDSRTLGFDDGGGSCGTAEGGRPSCVTAANSTSVRDGTVPGDLGKVQGPSRSGLETFDLGVGVALLRQAQDDTKPTWTVGLDFKLAVGNTRAYDRASPGDNTKIGPGYSTTRLSTYTSRRLGPVEPIFGIYYDLPFAADEKAFPGITGGQRESRPQMDTGLVAGIDATLYDKEPAAIGVTTRLNAMAKFKGRGWSELWEQLACARPEIDTATSTQVRLRGMCVLPDGNSQTFSGATDIDNYGIFAGHLEVWGVWKKLLRGALAFGVQHDQAHLITNATAGQDLNNDGQVDLTNRNEYNPLHHALVDTVGHRYRVEGSTTYHLMITAEALF